MKILIIPSWYEINTNRTLGSFFREQAEGLVKYGDDVAVAYAGFNGIKTIGKNSTGIKAYNKNGVHTYRYDTCNYLYDKFPIDIKSRIFKVKLFKLYRKIEKEWGKPDIIHVHSITLAGYGAVELALKYSIPIIVTEHASTFLHHKIKNDSRNLIKYSLDNSNKIIAVSEGLKNNLQRYTQKNDIVVIPNIVDTKKFDVANDSVSDSFTFLSVCYLSYNKGIDILLRAFAKAFKNNYNVKLKIGGSGRELKKLMALAKELNIEKKVEFLGALSREEVISSIKMADCFVLPSRFETFGVVLIEALASGIPVIASKTSGPLDIINKKNGVLFDINNELDLASSLISMTKNREIYNGEAIRAECIEKYSEESVLNKIKNIYLDVLSKGGEKNDK